VETSQRAEQLEKGTSMKISNLGANLLGSDYVCGDIHGSLSCVQNFLKEVHFDKSKDRLICAGDLIDRGPESEACLDLLDEPWFFSVFGNHEQLMVDFFRRRYYGAFWEQNGGHWGAKYVNQISEKISNKIDVLENLPYLITVEKKNGEKFHVIHAELFGHKTLAQNAQLTDSDLVDDKTFTDIASLWIGDGAVILWGRILWGVLSDTELTDELVQRFLSRAEIAGFKTAFDKLSHIYSGHTILRAPCRYKGQTNLDTGAYLSYRQHKIGCYGLTVTNPETDQFWLCTDRECKEIQPVVLA
jgi:serine/threonine protein phosphatase 1